MKQNDYYFISISITYVVTIVGLLLYFSFLKDFIKIPVCPVFEYLHFYCPACGGTRAMQALLKLDLLASLYYNPFILYTLVFTSFYLMNEICNYLFHKKNNIPYKWVVRIGLILLFVNFVIKNFFGIEMI